MLKVEPFQLLGGGRQDLISPKPADKVRVLVEAVGVEELVEHYPLCWQPVVTVVLVVLVAKLVHTHPLSAQHVVLLLDEKPLNGGVMLSGPHKEFF